MIQRIQSIYLFFAAVAGFGVLALPLANTAQMVATSSLFSDSAFTVSDNIGILVLFALAGTLAIATIFLFKNRLLQLKIGKLALGADILGVLLAAVLFWQDSTNVNTVPISGGVGAFLPLLFLVLTALALRAIKKDESLVRSADRLR